MRPGLSPVGGFVNAIAGRQIGALQSFAAAHINNVRVGRCTGQRADVARGLVVENRIPGVAEVSGFPDAAIDGRHVEDVRLVRHAGDGNGAASAEWSDAAPAHFGKEFLVKWLADILVQLLRIRHSAEKSTEGNTKNHCAGFTTSAWPPAARMGCSVPASPGGTSRAPRVSFSPSARPCVAEHARLFVAAYWSEESHDHPIRRRGCGTAPEVQGLARR